MQLFREGALRLIVRVRTCEYAEFEMQIIKCLGLYQR
jgi:hypothetical protein